jgi:hypothetical protein
MQLFLKKVVQFLLATLIVYLATVFMLGKGRIMFKGLNFFPIRPSRMINQIEDLGSIKKLNVLFLGSSHTYMSFDPRIFKKAGYTSFNFGSSSQTPLQGEFLYSKFVEEIDVDLIVYEICPLDIASSGVESNIELLNAMELDFPLFKLVLSLKTFRSINSLVYFVFNQWEGKLPEEKIDYEYIRGTGYSPIFKTAPKIKQKQKTSIFEVEEKQLAALFNLTNGWKRKNQKFILVQTPVTRNYYASISNSSEIDSLFNQIGPYVNYNNLENSFVLNLNDTIDFFDAHHLNQNGVEKFNQIFLADIEKLNLK